MRKADAETLKQNYLDRVFGGEDEHLVAIREMAHQHSRLGMQISPSEGRLLQNLIHWSNSKKVVEIGLLYGYSCLWMARALPTGGKIYSLEKNPEMYQLAKSNLEKAGVSGICELLLGEALNSLQTISSHGPFDFVFIDANKGGYLDYLDWAENNVRRGGFIVGDNTFLFGHVFGAQVEDRWGNKQIETMKEFNRRLADPLRYRSCMVPTQEGLTVAQKLFD